MLHVFDLSLLLRFPLVQPSHLVVQALDRSNDSVLLLCQFRLQVRVGPLSPPLDGNCLRSYVQSQEHAVPVLLRSLVVLRKYLPVVHDQSLESFVARSLVEPTSLLFNL